MKYLLILFLSTLISGCGPSDLRKLVGIRKFAVGDCLIQSLHDPEKWDVAEYKVIDIGINSYLIKAWRSEAISQIEFGHLWEDFYQKVPCRDGFIND